ncbi:hypothetical protein GCM10008955_14970 [Deinococcus malanensis]|uniref:Uncharacterized protein n=1 Tax=Deinococcus malanensis TaxID=1706855 RepID=A0ABQ2ERP2_9DEIO|nr:hypothetical protein GCM10008955_14970 [Deinococcus malanensis]
MLKAARKVVSAAGRTGVAAGAGVVLLGRPPVAAGAQDSRGSRHRADSRERRMETLSGKVR